MLMMSPSFRRDIDILRINDDPPTLYAFMKSYVGEDVSINDLVTGFKEYLFNFNYPLSNDYKSNFEEMFLKHFMFREIGFETFTSFKIHLEVKLNSIMGKYNKMLQGFNKLDFEGNVETHTRVENSTNTGSNNLTSESINDNRFSNVPQNEIEDIQDGSYMTDYTYNKNNTTNNNTINGSLNTNENITIKKGDTIDEYEKFLKFANNIYESIFDECNCLFLQVV